MSWRFVPGRLAALSALLCLASAAGATPPATILEDDVDLRERLLEHRRAEAATKARALEGLDEAVRMRTANQKEFDVVHYDIDIALDPTSQILSGTVTATADVIGNPISTMDFNLLSDMTVSAATCAGSPATFSHPNHIVTVDLDRTYSLGETIVVSVTYSGNPAGSSFGWDSHGTEDMIWTLSEPYGARSWWPCSDHNWDKADALDITVTVPDHLIVATTGLLVSDVDNGATRTFHWRTDYPIATYLVSLAIHPYTTYSDWYTPQGGGAPMEVQFYVYPDHFTSVQATYALTVPMIDAFAQSWGEYPFVAEKYGHAEFEWGGGMEHQTISSMGGWSEDLISHELAHQWWGDHVTCDDFGHIWLNEGFATWGEAFWKEQTEGTATYQDYMAAAAYYGPGTIFVANRQDENAIFDSDLSYNKASWVVHMLRHVVGDANFFAGLALYRANHGGGSAVTEDLRDVMETVSGQDLDAFFDQWIYGEYFPHYRFDWSDGGGTLDLTVEQIQTNTGLFTMPLDVRVTTDSGTFDFAVQNSQAIESYQLAVTGAVLEVELDPDRWILRRIDAPVTNVTLAQGILLVNGVDWDTYGTEITSAYADSAFWGAYPITFWDTFPAPAGGYPANLPTPLGHGAVPGDLIGQYSAVVWVGNHYNGDLADWVDSPIASYLAAGGNVLLLSRRGNSFLDGSLTSYLGIDWTSLQISLNNCTAVHGAFGDIPFTGSQSWNDVFSTSVGPNSTLLFRDGVSRGTGVIVEPPGGGTHRPDGAKLAYLAGRPYRMSHAALRGNVEVLLGTFFGEIYDATPAPGVAPTPTLALAPGRPNPFASHTVIPFSLAREGKADLVVYDVSGRLVRRLVSGRQTAGHYTVRWDGHDAAGRRVTSGVYWIRLRTPEGTRTESVVRLR